MSAASFLGISAWSIRQRLRRPDLFVGWLVGWPIVTFLIAEPLRNLGKFTFADVACSASARRRSAWPRPARWRHRGGLLPDRRQMVGAGTLIQLLFGLTTGSRRCSSASMMIAYVTFRRHARDDLVQIIKAMLLLGGATFMAFMVLLKHSASARRPMFAERRPRRSRQAAHPRSASRLAIKGRQSRSVLGDPRSVSPDVRHRGLPHILMRFFTVADAKAARKSVFYATTFIGYFYILTFIIGFGAIVLV